MLITFMHVFTAFSILLCSFGLIGASISSYRVNDVFKSFDSTVNTALNNSLDFVDHVQMVGVNHVVIVSIVHNSFL